MRAYGSQEDDLMKTSADRSTMSLWELPYLSLCLARLASRRFRRRPSSRLVQGQSACPSRAEVGLRLMSRRPPCSFSISTARRIRPKALATPRPSRVVWLPCPKVEGLLAQARAKGMFVVYSLGGSAAPQDIATAIAPSANDPVVKSARTNLSGRTSTSCSTTRE